MWQMTCGFMSALIAPTGRGRGLPSGEGLLDDGDYDLTLMSERYGRGRTSTDAMIEPSRRCTHATLRSPPSGAMVAIASLHWARRCGRVRDLCQGGRQDSG
jgi:hypothetical protein